MTTTVTRDTVLSKCMVGAGCVLCVFLSAVCWTLVVNEIECAFWDYRLHQDSAVGGLARSYKLKVGISRGNNA